MYVTNTSASTFTNTFAHALASVGGGGGASTCASTCAWDLGGFGCDLKNADVRGLRRSWGRGLKNADSAGFCASIL